MNFNLIPDSLVNQFQKADDENTLVNILSDKKSENIVVECNPGIHEFDLYCVVRYEDLNDFKKFISQKTNSNISKNRLASEKDYKLVLRFYDEYDEYIEFGILECDIAQDRCVFKDKVGYELELKVHTFDALKAEIIYLEDVEKIRIHDNEDKFIEIDPMDETSLMEYNFI